MNRLTIQNRALILGCLVEGNSMRATSRMCDVSINTVTKLLVDLGTACSEYQYNTLRNLKCARVQVDEIWSFCYAKAKNVPAEKHGEFGVGDVYTWVALDADSKLVPSWLVGKRDAAFAHLFMDDLALRMANRIQLTSDGHKARICLRLKMPSARILTMRCWSSSTATRQAKRKRGATVPANAAGQSEARFAATHQKKTFPRASSNART